MKGRTTMFFKNSIVQCKSTPTTWVKVFDVTPREEAVRIVGTSLFCNVEELSLSIEEMKTKHEKAASFVRAFIHAKKPADIKIVRSFLFAVIDYVLPLNLLGCMKNKRGLKLFLGKIPQKGMHEAIFINYLVGKADLSSIKWINSASDKEKIEIYEKVIVWLLHTYIFAVLKHTFFIIKSANTNKLIYIWKKQWPNLAHNAFGRQFKYKCQFEADVNEKMLGLKGISCLELQFRAKKVGMRPIMVQRKNHRKRTEDEKCKNILLKFLTRLFKEERSGSPVKNGTYFITIWKEKIPMFTKKRHHTVRMDVKDAFGSVNHDILEEILKTLFRKYFKPNSLLSMKTCWIEGKKELLIEGLDENFNSTKGAVEEYSAELMLGLIVKFFRFQVFKWMGKMYTLREGLAQGGLLSVALCNLYLHAMEIQYLLPFCKKDSLLIRQVDDYLYVTPSLDGAKRFYSFLKKGIDFYNIRINKKTQTSASDRFINFLGYSIDTVTMELSLDFTKYYGEDLSNLLRLDCYGVSKPGKFIKDKICKTCVLPVQLFDSTINSFKKIVEVIFQCSCLQAGRVHYMIKHFLKDQDSRIILRSCVKLCASIIEKKVAEKLGHSGMGRYIALRGFYEVCKRFKNGHAVRYIQKILNDSRKDVRNLEIIEEEIQNIAIQTINFVSSGKLR